MAARRVRTPAPVSPAVSGASKKIGKVKFPFIVFEDERKSVRIFAKAFRVVYMKLQYGICAIDLNALDIIQDIMAFLNHSIARMAFHFGCYQECGKFISGIFRQIRKRLVDIALLRGLDQIFEYFIWRARRASGDYKRRRSEPYRQLPQNPHQNLRSICQRTNKAGLSVS